MNGRWREGGREERSANEQLLNLFCLVFFLSFFLSFFLFFFFAMQHSLQDLSSPTSNGTQALGSESTDSDS